MFRALLACLLLASSAFAQNISTDPAVTGALTQEAFEPGGQFFPSGLTARGTVINSTRTGSINVIGGPVIQIGPQLAIQQGLVNGTVGYTIDLSSPHPTAVHAPFSNSASTSATINESNQTRSINFNINVNATLDHPANGYDGPQGDGFPAPSSFGAIDVYTIDVSGQIEAVFRQGFGQSGGDQAPLGPGRPNQQPQNLFAPEDRSRAGRPNSVVFLPTNSSSSDYEQAVPFDPGQSNATEQFYSNESGLFDTDLSYNPPAAYSSDQLVVDVKDREPITEWVATQDYLLDLGNTSFFRWVGQNRDELQFASDAFLFAGTSILLAPYSAAKGLQIASKSRNVATWGQKGSKAFKAWWDKLKFVKVKKKGSPKAPKKFITPTNKAQHPPNPKSLPKGHYVRKEFPKEGPMAKKYPNGYWRQYNANGQGVNPSTGKPPSNVSKAEFQSQTHVRIPPP